MGGMTTLEWALCTPPGYVKNVIPIATSAYQGAWGISWSESQRRAIYTDPMYKHGWYKPSPSGQPQNGLGTARMIAMLTYRSHNSFEARFGRTVSAFKKKNYMPTIDILPSPPTSDTSSATAEAEDGSVRFSAQSYLDYQMDKFLTRFDANCYIHLTKKMDTHDITRGRVARHIATPLSDDLHEVLSTIPPNALVIGVQSDMLFPLSQQRELAQHLPRSKFLTLESGDGHDAFLLEFSILNDAIRRHLKDVHPWIYVGDADLEVRSTDVDHGTMNSIFGEAEDTTY